MSRQVRGGVSAVLFSRSGEGNETVGAFGVRGRISDSDLRELATSPAQRQVGLMFGAIVLGLEVSRLAVLARPDGEQKAGDGDGSSQPEGQKASRPELEIKKGRRDASRREEDDRDQEDEDTQDARGSRLEAPGGFGIGGFDLPVEKKENPDHGKERFVEPEHSGPPGAEGVYAGERGELPGHATFRRPIYRSNAHPVTWLPVGGKLGK